MIGPCGPGLGCQVAAAASALVGGGVASVARHAEAVGERLPAFWPLVAACVGATAASLSGLVVDRLPRIGGWPGHEAEAGLGLASPPSNCDRCGQPVPARALVPFLGWFVALGKCPGCGGEVPWIYPAVEGATAFVSMAFVLLNGPTYASLMGCVAIWLLVLVAWLDWREQVIPDGLSVPLFFLGLLASPFEADAWARGLGACVTGACVWTAFRLVSSVKRVDAMALGDVALGAALGAWTGFCSVPALLLCSMAAYLLYALPLRLRSGQVWVPMGPALAAGFLVVATLGLRIPI